MNGDTVSTSTKKTNVGRAWLAGVLIVLGVVITPAAILTHWATAQVTNTQRFVETLSPLASNPAVQNTIISEITKTIDNAVDVDGVTDSLLSGLGSALNLPDAAKKALGLVSDPIANGVKGLITDVVTKAVKSDVFQTTWTKTLTLTQEQAIDLLSNNGKSVLSLSNDGTLSLPLKPIITELKADMVAKGVAFANLIPVVDTTITLVKIPELATARVIYQVGTGVGAWLPWVALALLIGGIFAANRRPRALFGAGVAIAVLMALLGIAIALGKTILTATVNPTYSAVAVVIFDAVISYAAVVVLAVGVAGVIAAITGWSFGTSAAATAFRAWLNKGFNAARAAIAPSDASFARVSAQLHSFRIVVRLIIIVGLAAATLAIAPLNVWAVLGFTALALVLLAIYEVLSRSIP
ncbi:MAG: hypothetical protein RIR88_772, partial [Actinomycetota bacterium]